MNWPMFALLTLAAARATHLVADDLFPFGYLRDRLDESSSRFANWLGSGMGCTFCVSVHAGFWAALLAHGLKWQPYSPIGSWADFGGFLVVWFAIAGGVVLLEAWLWNRSES